MSAHRAPMRVGRVARWQRRFSYAVLAACAVSGVVWFVLMDAYDLPPSKLTFWWVGHGIASFVTLLAIGCALPMHVTATWRHHRNRLAGALTLASLTIAGGSALLLLYGSEAWHTGAHWTHVAIGLAALLAFPWHVLRGRHSVGRRP
jgi:hypothetical protein